LEYDLVIEGKAVTPSGAQELQIGVSEGKIAEIKKQGLNGVRKISTPHTCVIFPGFIDAHVHLREPGWEQKEDFQSGTKAAIHGGVTTVFDMPNNPVPATNARTVGAKVRLAASKAKVDVKFFGGVDGQLSDIEEIKNMVIGYKLYLAETTGNLRLSSEIAGAALAAVSRTKKPASLHCEEQSIIDRQSENLAGQDRPDLHCDLRPPRAEVESIRSVLAFRGEAKVNICHVSTSDSLGLIGEARNHIPEMACEVTLHHLFFSRNDMLNSQLLKTNPPLRSEADRIGMLEGLRAGSIDFLVTDHAPHTLVEKRENGACGVPGLDNYGNIVTWLIRNHDFSLDLIAAVCSGNQAKFFGLDDRGAIALGKRADFTLLDINSPDRVDAQAVKSKCGWSPYEGCEFPGRVRWTILQGRPLLEDFEFTA
jgi:dihydroorotase